MASIQFPVSDDFEILVDIHAASSFESAGGTTKSEDEILGIIRLKRPRILIVDNEDRFRRSLAFKLQARYNAVVEEAETGAEALDKAEENRGLDLILMDISMPVMSGLEACKKLRGRGIDMPIVLMSAYYEENQAQAKALGVTLLNKPLDRDALEKILLECGGEKPHD